VCVCVCVCADFGRYCQQFLADISPEMPVITVDV